MSSRYDYGKGSSRSARDDSRHERRGRERDRSRSPRSRSPRRRHSPVDHKYPKERSNEKSKDREERHTSKSNKYSEWDDSEEEVPAPPPPPRISKISIGFQKPKAPITMTLSGPSKVIAPAAKPTIASVFNDDDEDDEPEEMPAEARMRMRNIGRETPTSAGPNSFGKTKQGFCDAKKVFEKNLKQALEPAEKSGPSMPKFPQTIYKIKP